MPDSPSDHTDLDDVLCDRMVALRANAGWDAIQTLSITTLPLVIFAFVGSRTFGASTISMWMEWGARPGDFPMFDAVKKHLLRHVATTVGLPFIVFYDKIGTLFERIAVGGPERQFWKFLVILLALCVFVASAVCAGSYLKYRYRTLHFQYALKEGADGKVCVTERITPEDRNRGLACNPGLAKDKQQHHGAVYSHLQKLFAKLSCKEGANEPVKLGPAKTHMRVAVRNVASRAQTWKRMYRVMGHMCIVLEMFVVTATVGGLFFMFSQNWGAMRVWASNGALIVTAGAVATVVVATVAVLLKRSHQLESAASEEFMDLSTKIAACKDVNVCRNELKDSIDRGPSYFFGATSRSPAKAKATSIVLLSTIVAIVSVGCIAVYMVTAKPYRVAVGLRELNRPGIHQFMSSSASVVGGAVDGDTIKAKLALAGDLIGDIPDSHIAMWAGFLTSASLGVWAMGTKDIVESVGRM